jgi:hypothetical protein
MTGSTDLHLSPAPHFNTFKVLKEQYPEKGL